jgi:hypothetical protein
VIATAAIHVHLPRFRRCVSSSATIVRVRRSDGQAIAAALCSLADARSGNLFGSRWQALAVTEPRPLSSTWRSEMPRVGLARSVLDASVF